jgi:hypothetical protein
VLAVAEDPGAYRPKTEVTRQAYEQLLHMLSSFMGEQVTPRACGVQKQGYLAHKKPRPPRTLQ